MITGSAPFLRHRSAALPALLVALLFAGIPTLTAHPMHHTTETPARVWQDEIFYQIFPRSFYDSNGDHVGDIRGIMAKLDYLQDLGVTGIWTTPILKARCYHNYYPDSFDELDPEFGTWEDWTALVAEMHRRGMKIIMDMEPQYVADLHPWYASAKGNPASEFTPYLWFEDSLNQKAATRKLGTYDTTAVTIINVRMNNAGVREAVTKLFRKFADPNGDGSLENGVDGFRIDHMMDDLDNRKMNVNLYQEFWTPLIADLKSLNPNIFFLAEQADWGFGKDAMTKGACDAAFAFPQWWGSTTFNKERLAGLVDTTWMNTPPGKEQFTFIENHDIDRFATAVGGNSGKLKIGAALNILLKGVPCLYYGQELGLMGKKGEWRTDGNDIPLREGFPWSVKPDDRGMAVWYKGTGPWWDHSIYATKTAPSLKKQMNDPGSLWNYYRDLIRLRKSSAALRTGSYERVQNDNDSVFSFRRLLPESNEPGSACVVVMNFSGKQQKSELRIGMGESFEPVRLGPKPPRNAPRATIAGSAMTVTLPPYGIAIFSRK